MDERRLERALREGPPFATRYAPRPLALDEQLVVDRPLGVDRLVLLVAVMALLLAGMVAGLAALSAVPDDDRDLVEPERGFVAPFIGLPPAGAMPSTPETGELVFSLYGRTNPTKDVLGIWVYADGRLIWRRSLDTGPRGFGAAEPTKAVIEQRLTPEGVELLRSEVLSAGLSGMDPDSECGGPVYWAHLAIRVGNQIIRGAWCGTKLPERIASFASWLPASAWADQRIRGYVPSRYAVCIGPEEERARVMDQLPESTWSLLETYVGQGILPDPDPPCIYQATTNNARAIAAMFDNAGLERSFFDSARVLGYAVSLEGASDGYVFFDPILPNGELVEYRQ